MTKQIFKQSVGLDISKDTFAACFSQRQADREFRILSSKSFKSTGSALQQFDKWIQKYRCEGVALHFLMEATGVYYEELAYFLNTKGYRVTVLLPNRTAAYAKSLDYKSKTDKIDAQMLAQMSLERNLPKWEPLSSEMLKIKRLSRERAELLDASVVLKNRLHAKKHAYNPLSASLSRSGKSIDFLQKQVTEIEQELAQLVEQDDFLRPRIEQVCSITGVGFITAITIIGETNAFDLFKNKAQLVCYAGYDVIQRQSGSSIQGMTKISGKGNYRIRKALHFPALVIVKSDPNFKALFDRVMERTQIKMKAYVAVQRKLLVLIYAIFKSNQPYDPKFVSVKKPLPIQK